MGGHPQIPPLSHAQTFTAKGEGGNTPSAENSPKDFWKAPLVDFQEFLCCWFSRKLDIALVKTTKKKHKAKAKAISLISLIFNIIFIFKKINMMLKIREIKNCDEQLFVCCWLFRWIRLHSWKLPFVQSTRLCHWTTSKRSQIIREKTSHSYI